MAACFDPLFGKLGWQAAAGSDAGGERVTPPALCGSVVAVCAGEG